MPEIICGLDEAGRGPLAGPVTAGACVLPDEFPREILGDSKALTARQRERAFVMLQERAYWGLGWCDAGEIDRINILQASLLAMARALEDLQIRFPDLVMDRAVADGLQSPQVPLPCTALVRGDALLACISGASILAKVARDRFMEQAGKEDPRYGFEVHKGYPTEAHRRALEAFGPGPLHRVSFSWKKPRQGELGLL
ncbi:MAG TPA: ribonuclease HII [Spirochaetia bacterium]|jgi:ribonuclease HII|nr:ribonuclease HII [Spirochaetia bacterium]